MSTGLPKNILTEGIQAIVEKAKLALLKDLTPEQAHVAGFSDVVCETIELVREYAMDNDYDPLACLSESSVSGKSVAHTLGGWEEFEYKGKMPKSCRPIVFHEYSDSYLVHKSEKASLEQIIGPIVSRPVRPAPSYALEPNQFPSEAPDGANLIMREEHKVPTICDLGPYLIADPCYLPINPKLIHEWKTGHTFEWVQQEEGVEIASTGGDGIFYGVAVDTGLLVKFSREKAQEWGILEIVEPEL